MDEKWQPGKDFDNCIKEEIEAFPTVRFEGKDGSIAEYEGMLIISLF